MVEGVGGAMLEATLIPIVFSAPWIYAVFGVAAISTLALWSPEIIAFLDPADRVIRRGEAKRDRQYKEDLRLHIRGLRKTGLFRRVEYDAAKGSITATIMRVRTWKGRVMRGASWLANHQMLPESGWLWIGRHLGFRLKDESPDYPPDPAQSNLTEEQWNVQLERLRGRPLSNDDR